MSYTWYLYTSSGRLSTFLPRTTQQQSAQQQCSERRRIGTKRRYTYEEPVHVIVIVHILVFEPWTRMQS